MATAVLSSSASNFSSASRSSRITARLSAPVSRAPFAHGQKPNASTTSTRNRWLIRRTSSSKLIGHRQERHLVVGLAQARRERAYEVPEQLVGEVAIDEQQ